MIRKCEAADAKAVFGFIGDDYGHCPYLYMDLLQYGFETPFVSVWREDGDDGAIASVWLRYHSGMHVYAPHGYADVDGAVEFVRSERPAMLCGTPDALMPLSGALAGHGYGFTEGIFCKYVQPPDALEPIDARLATSEEDFRRVGEMLYADEQYGASYKPGELADQLMERYRLGQGRSFVVERDGRIVTHVCIAAECDKFTILSGGVTDPQWRGRGLCSRLVVFIAEMLKGEGKESYSMYYNPVAAALHRGTGFVDQCAWGRLFLTMR